MISLDLLIEPSGLFVWNKYQQATPETADTWVAGSASSYGSRTFYYDENLVPGNKYFMGTGFKYTTTGTNFTWVYLYGQGGDRTGPGRTNPAPNIEYLMNSIFNATHNHINQILNSGTLYHNNSNYSGTQTYTKNPFCYDVTELFKVLQARGLASDDSTLLAWCNTNIGYHNYKEKVFLGDLFEDADKVVMKNGAIVADKVVEEEGIVNRNLRDYTASKYTFFDNGLSNEYFYVYNNTGNGNVTHTIVDAKEQGSPFYNEHPNVVKIVTNGTATPNAGGFYYLHQAAASKVVLETVVAKIPVGYTMHYLCNPQGTNPSISFVNPDGASGTGEWKEYKILYRCGSTGSFSSGGHVDIGGSNDTNVTWYVAYVSNLEITNEEDLLAMDIMPNKLNTKSGTVAAKEFNERNLFVDGRTFKGQIPSGYTLDYDDVPPNSNALCSLVQPVGVGNWSAVFTNKIAIDCSCRYRISYWVKCKRDMTSFLTNIRYYDKNGVNIWNGNHAYIGDPALLTQALNPGDTVMHLSTVSGWKVSGGTFLGFRSGGTWSLKPYNDLGRLSANDSSGIVESVDTTAKTVTLKKAYSGDVQPVNRVVVLGQDMASYPYPITKGMLPTDNEWHYVEGYFGVEGRGTNGLETGTSGWSYIPCTVTQMAFGLNGYSNTGTVPIKYADVRIEPVGSRDSHKHDGKIQISQLK